MDPKDVTALRERFAEQEDGRLVAIALTAAANLTPVARGLLQAELAKRNLVPELWPTLEPSAEQFGPERLDAIALRLQFLPCPLCGATGTSLNGFVSAPATPLDLVGIAVVPRFRIGCRSCLAKEGAWRLFPLEPGRRWKPSAAFREWVFSHAALLAHFEDNAAAIAALLRLDYDGFVAAIASPSNPRSRP